MKDPCPSSGVWQSLLNGTLEEEQSGWLAEHLDTCAGCRELLDRLAGQGTTTLAFAEELPASSQSSAELARLLAELKGQARGGDVARWDIRPFLKPATRPGALGWFGGCEVLGIIAHGGMGIVLEARDPALDRVVAIKVLAPAVAGRESYRQRFVREARAAAAVQHDHIVVIHAVGEEAGLPFIVMQRLAGPSLQEYLAQAGPLPPDNVVRVGQQIASALQAAHDAGLVHRDIKPANVLCEVGLARVRVTDFGLVHSVNQPTTDQGRVIAGTPQFMSPEQAAGEPVTPASDLFSFGSTLYALATGRPPFEASSLGALLERTRSGSPAPIEAQRPDLPVKLARLIWALMAREPRARPTAAQASEQLAVLARPANRTAAVWGFLALVMILSLLGGGLIWRERTGAGAGPLRFTIESSGATFDSLAACVLAAESGDTIEVSGEEPLEVEPLQILGKALRIRATPPAQPELIGLDRQQPLIETDSSLVLEGITLEHRIAERLAPPLIRITNGSLRLAYCRLMKTSLVPRMPADRVFCIEAFDSPRVELYHCEVVPLERAVGGVFARFERESHPGAPHAGILDVQHSLMAGLEAFELENTTSRPVQVELARSVFVNRAMLRLDDRVPANLLNVTASDCVFDVVSLLFGATLDPDAFGRQFRWVGSSNRFSVRLGFVSMPNRGRPSPMPGYPVTSSRWAELEQVTETGSRSASLSFWDGLLEEGAQPQAIRADRLVLPSTLELGNAPNVTRIGPGAPYAAWRGSETYQAWERPLVDGG